MGEAEKEELVPVASYISERIFVNGVFQSYSISNVLVKQTQPLVLKGWFQIQDKFYVLQPISEFEWHQNLENQVNEREFNENNQGTVAYLERDIEPHTYGLACGVEDDEVSLIFYFLFSIFYFASNLN